ncbi:MULTISPECIES: GOLPH3/VPS74 family protein [Aeromicrobium]|nr:MULTISPECIES: GPP34 family phosphoprotein [Aeromicrobium]
MTTAENFLLVLTDSDTGKAPIGQMAVEPVFGGAFLFDLVAAGRLELQGTGRKARLVVTDPTPVPDPLLQAAFERVLSARRPLTPQSAVSRLGKKGRERTYDALAAAGAVRPRPEKALGLFPVTRHDVVDVARREALLAGIRASLLNGQPADETTGPIIGLLSAADLTKAVVDKPDRSLAKARAKVISEGDWASASVRKAIQAAQSAITTTIVAATIVTSSSS